MNMPLPTLATFAAYLAAMLVLGIIAYRSTSNLSDYVLGLPVPQIFCRAS